MQNKRSSKKSIKKKNTPKNFDKFILGTGIEPKKGKWFNVGKVAKGAASLLLTTTMSGVLPSKLTDSNSGQEININIKEATITSPQILGAFDANQERVGLQSDNCKYWACLNFLDWTSFTTHPNLQLSPGGLVCATTSPLGPGGVVYLKDPFVSGEFTLVANFIPQGSTEFNTSLRWGDNFDFTVGDNSLDRISVKTPAGYVAPKGSLPGYNRYRLEKPIKPNTPVDLRLKVEFVDFQTIKLSPTISYTSSNEEVIKDYKIPDFIFASATTTWRINQRVGIKLVDPNKKSDICTVFNTLDIEAN